MSSLLPSSIADERWRAVEQIWVESLAALPLSSMLVYAIDSAHESLLPSLAWQFSALGAAWQAADTVPKKRTLIKRVLVRRRKRGTHWAVWDALDAAEHVADVRDGAAAPILHDGSFMHDGTIDHQQSPTWMFWVVIVSPSEPSADTIEQVRAIVREWQRKSQRFELFWVTAEELLEETLEYHRVH